MRLKTLTIFHVLFLIGVLVFSSCSSKKSVNRDEEYNTLNQNESIVRKDDKKLIREAKKWLGTKYKYGGHSKNGTDCSGFVMEVYKAVYKIKLPRTSKEQQRFCKKINKSNLKIGDLVFFATGKTKGKVSHVGIYIGNGEFIHASSSKGVLISKLDQGYYVRTYHSSGRISEIKH